MAKAKRRTKLEASIDGLSGIEGGNWFKPADGRNVIRILPAFHTKGDFDGLFFNRLILHRGIPMEGQKRTVACTKNFGHSECPICTFINHLKETGKKDDEKLAKEIRPQEVFFVNVIDRASGNKVKKYGMKKSMMKSLRSYLMDPDYGDITDPEDGRDIVIEKEGQGMQTRYTLKVRPKVSEIDNESWEDDMFDLFKDGECADFTTPKEVVKIMKSAFGSAFSRSYDAGVDDSEEEEEENDKSSVDLDDLDRDELKAFIKEKGLDIKVKKAMSDDDIREEIEDALADKNEEEEEEEEED